jgi:hypothetical protein
MVAAARKADVNFAETLVADDLGGWVLGDRDYRSKPFQKALWHQRRVYLHTSVKRNKRKESPLPIETIRTLSGKRRLVETVAGQLEQRFRIKTTFARDLWHLLNRIIHNILSHTVRVWLDLKFNNYPLKLRLLIN